MGIDRIKIQELITLKAGAISAMWVSSDTKAFPEEPEGTWIMNSF